MLRNSIISWKAAIVFISIHFLDELNGSIDDRLADFQLIDVDRLKVVRAMKSVGPPINVHESI